MRRLQNLLMVVAMAAAADAVGFAAEAPKTTVPPTGNYECNVMAGKSYFEGGTFAIQAGNKYVPPESGVGTFDYDAATQTLTFKDGPYGDGTVTGQYSATATVKGGVPKRKGPLLVLKQKTEKGKKRPEFLTQYCYLAKAKAVTATGKAAGSKATNKAK